MSILNSYSIKDVQEGSLLATWEAVEAASPESCASDSEYSRSFLSSDCSELTCSETDIGDAYVNEDEAEDETLPKLPGSDGDVAPALSRVVDPSSVELLDIILADLQKQQEMRPKPASACVGTAESCVLWCLPETHRNLIVGWMCQVARALRVHTSTLFTAVSYLDRFMADTKAFPPDGMLQLVALACVSVAVKYNEVGQMLPSVWLGLAVDPTGKRMYTAQDLQRMEWTLLQTLGWQLHVPTTHTFLQHFLLLLHGRGPASSGDPALDLPKALASLTCDAGVLRRWPLACGAMALAELSLMSGSMLSYDYSTIALACVALAERLMCNTGGSGSGAASAVSAACGLSLESLAPDLERCWQDLDCCWRTRTAGAARR